MSVLNKTRKGDIYIERLNQLNIYLMYIFNPIQELYRVSKFSYPKGAVIMIITYKVIFPNTEVIKTVE